MAKFSDTCVPFLSLSKEQNREIYGVPYVRAHFWDCCARMPFTLLAISYICSVRRGGSYIISGSLFQYLLRAFSILLEPIAIPFLLFPCYVHRANVPTATALLICHLWYPKSDSPVAYGLQQLGFISTYLHLNIYRYTYVSVCMKETSKNQSKYDKRAVHMYKRNIIPSKLADISDCNGEVRRL